MIVVIDYGMGNVGSILNMLKKIGAKATASAEFPIIEDAEKLVLPGVGAFDNAMKKLADIKLVPLLTKKVLKDKTPFLGVCLGMQLLTKRSEEGSLPGLGWIDAETVRFKSASHSLASSTQGLRVPHMGWNTVRVKKQCCLTMDMDEESRFYFVHSYYVKCKNPDNVLMTTTYGIEFCSAVIKDNILGVQFHPEKSHKFGMRLLRNFAEKC